MRTEKQILKWLHDGSHGTVDEVDDYLLCKMIQAEEGYPSDLRVQYLESLSLARETLDRCKIRFVGTGVIMPRLGSPDIVEDIAAQLGPLPRDGGE